MTYGYGLGYGGYGYGLGLGCGGCCAPCLQCFYPKLVDACPVQIGCGAIYPDECGQGLLDPCYGGIRAPAAHCQKKKCCESSTNGCGLNYQKPKNQWYSPAVTVSNPCNSCCNSCCGSC